MKAWALANVPLDTQGNLLLETFPDGGTIVCDPEVFATMTATLTTTPPTHAELSALPIASRGGWQKYFDEWKTKGIIT